jgi:hypothetical protein
VDSAKYLEEGSAPELLGDVLNAFGRAGLAANPDICHYCRREKVEMLTCREGKVAQICPACLQERISASANRPADATAGIFPIFLICPAASVVGAFGWTLVWISHDWLFRILNTKYLFIPRMAELAAVFCVAFLVGGPVGWLIKQIRRRGRAISVSAGVMFAIAAVALGEVLYLTWLIYDEFKVVSFSAAVRAMPDYYLHNDGLYLGIKVLAAFASVALAYIMAKPEKAKLDL